MNFPSSASWPTDAPLQQQPQHELQSKRKSSRLAIKEDLETQATQSSSEKIDDQFSDFELPEVEKSTVRVELKGKQVRFDSLERTAVESGLAKLKKIEKNREKLLCIKILILDRLCQYNGQLEEMLDSACDEYAQNRISGIVS